MVTAPSECPTTPIRLASISVGAGLPRAPWGLRPARHPGRPASRLVEPHHAHKWCATRHFNGPQAPALPGHFVRYPIDEGNALFLGE